MQQGILAATSLLGDERQEAGAEPAVFLAPAYTFLLRNRPVDYQFWLNVGGDSWCERIYQPLTQPHVLSRRVRRPGGRPRDGKWTDADEVRARREALSRLVLGLSRRCRKQIHLAHRRAGRAGPGGARPPAARPAAAAAGRAGRTGSGEGGPMSFTPRLHQQKVLEYRAGYMGVSAVPGSGKTSTLSALAARLVGHWPTRSWRATADRRWRRREGARAEGPGGGSTCEEPEVLIVTFANSAVDNFSARIRERS